MRRLPFLLAAALVAGCGGNPKPLDMATTPEAARVALTAALDAWKAGETRDALTARTPPLHLGDDDFTRGRRLQEYKIEGEPKPVGTGLSYAVTLTFADGKGPSTRKVAYRVVTTPNQSVTREDFQP